MFENYAAFREALSAAIAVGEPQLSQFWEALVATQRIPFVMGEDVAFIYRGEAFSIAWHGDFTRWMSSTDTEGKRLGQTDLWLMEMKFPPDARFDYKIVVDDEMWILDPANARIQHSGFGPNSELAMPEFQYDPYVNPQPGRPAGTLHPETTHESANLGYGVRYQVYTPPGSPAGPLPVIYATDGHEYSDPRRGALPIVLDNLLGEGLIRPAMVVFIDPRNVNDLSDNRRLEQYQGNAAFMRFIAEELVPVIDSQYSTLPQPDGRVILGASMGGLLAALLGWHHPDTFGQVAMQSPSFALHHAIYDVVRQREGLPLKLWLSSGTPGWDVDTRAMRAILMDKGFDMHYEEVNQGHSWGQWRSQMSAICRHFLGG